jgi:anionic cell wall polymer biosynthesis LytR-Cps2A-Psr (LCP) family protein
MSVNMSTRPGSRPGQSGAPGGRGGGGQPPRSGHSRRDHGPIRPRRRDPLWAKLVIVFGALVMLGSGLLVVVPKLAAHWALGGVAQQNIIPPELKGTDINGAINFLLVGSDARDPTAAPEDATSPIHSDSTMLVHIPADHSKVYMISLPRDSKVDFPADPRLGIGEHSGKLTDAFGQAAVTDKGARDDSAAGYGNGAVYLMKVISNIVGNTGGLRFNGWATINFDGFDKVVQALGSVYMCFDEDVYSVHYWANSTGQPADGSLYNYATYTGDYTRGYHYPKGQCRNLQPWEALDYSRQRYSMPDGDYGRQRHQQQLIKAIMKKILSPDTLTNFNTIQSLQKSVGSLLNLDLGGKAIEDWVFTLKNLRSSDMIMVQTNAAHFAPVACGDETCEEVTPTMIDLLHDVQKDDVFDFLAQHPDWIAKDAA